eukprot:Seg4333.1 transcript_id=Seg4333.1/GoldUCD/mRNA.D3Y31 product="Beta-1 4-galactosyltransferase 1" protein_id=Seg4333.1/GoldUCD/D3Y31
METLNFEEEFFDFLHPISLFHFQIHPNRVKSKFLRENQFHCFFREYIEEIKMWLFRNMKNKNSIIPFSICIVFGLIVFCERKFNFNFAVLSSASSMEPHLLTDLTSNVENQDHCRETLSEKAETIAGCGKGRNLVGPLFVKKDKVNWEEIKKEVGVVNHGGQYSPKDCMPKFKTAIIIPYRDREEHLKILLRQLHPMLKRQDIYYHVFVIEQAGKSGFNRGRLLNAGFQEALKFANFNCFIFHDVDLIPEDDRIYYGCSKSPMHLSVAVDKFGYELLNEYIFGGVEMFSKDDFQKINGFSNLFWKWGGEDDNLYQRLGQKGLTLKRPSISVARYTMIRHEQSPMNPNRFELLEKANDYTDKDGLNSLQYNVTDLVQHACYTKIMVDVHGEKDKRTT